MVIRENIMDAKLSAIYDLIQKHGGQLIVEI